MQLLLMSSITWAGMFSAPLINDITTTYPHVPQFYKIAQEQAERNFTYRDEFYSQQSAYYKDLKPLALSLTPSEAFTLVVSLAEKQPRWKIVDIDRQNLRLEATATTALLRFKDDLVIEVRAGAQPDGCEIHMRSKSRTGKGDLGANAARIQKFFKELQDFR